MAALSKTNSVCDLLIKKGSGFLTIYWLASGSSKKLNTKGFQSVISATLAKEFERFPSVSNVIANFLKGRLFRSF